MGVLRLSTETGSHWRAGAAEMTTSIFCKGCRKDRFFMEYLLRSLEKFASGFLEIIVVLPEMDRLHFEGVSFHGSSVRWVDEPDGQNYLRQQVFKLRSDEYCAGDLIFVIDSDCFFFDAITPEMFAPTGKPISLLRHWENVGTAEQWRPIVEKFLTFQMIFEGMAALPFIIDRRVLPLIREYAQATHGCSIDEYILRQPNNEFSEFNALSAFAHRFTPHLYDWKIADPESDGFPRRHWQRWSWDEAGVGPFQEDYERILAS